MPGWQKTRKIRQELGVMCYVLWKGTDISPGLIPDEQFRPTGRFRLALSSYSQTHIRLNTDVQCAHL